MSGDAPGERRSVRVRRSPKVPVFLVLGLLLGAVVGAVLTLTGAGDPRFSTAQILGFLVLMFAPLGAVVGGLVAVVLDAISSRRARTVDAERAPSPSPGPSPEPPQRPEP